MKLLAMSILSLACASAMAAPVNQVAYGSLTGTQIVDFDDVAGGPFPGVNYDSVFVSHGVGLGERFVGQTVSFVGDNDKLSGAPTGPLTLTAGAPGRNLEVFLYTTSNVLTGLGHLGFPDPSATGEGAFALTFSSDQSEFGFQLVGGNAGNAFIDFFRADGSLIDSVTVSGLADSFYGFAREGGVNPRHLDLERRRWRHWLRQPEARRQVRGRKRSRAFDLCADVRRPGRCGRDRPAPSPGVMQSRSGFLPERSNAQGRHRAGLFVSNARQLTLGTSPRPSPPAR